ncbi:MAG: hypothetical protein Q4P14_05460, partial [Methanobacteriaceae archaeon]|nr:hypothetical protein [Methanobacteriaceae archaeon]
MKKTYFLILFMIFFVVINSSWAYDSSTDNINNAIQENMLITEINTNLKANIESDTNMNSLSASTNTSTQNLQ